MLRWPILITKVQVGKKSCQSLEFSFQLPITLSYNFFEWGLRVLGTPQKLALNQDQRNRAANIQTGFSSV